MITNDRLMDLAWRKLFVDLYNETDNIEDKGIFYDLVCRYPTNPDWSSEEDRLDARTLMNLGL